MDETLMTGQGNTAPDEGTTQAAGEGTAPAQGSQQSGTTDGAQATPQGDAQGDAAKPEQQQDYTFQTPDGYTLDGEIGDAFKATAKELGLTNEQAQKLIDLDVRRAQAQQSAMSDTAKAWAEAVHADAEIGGDKLPENLGMAKKALSAFGTPQLVDLLDKSGLGNHPEIVRAFVRVGKAISEDRVVTGRQTASGDRDPAKVLFPEMS